MAQQFKNPTNIHEDGGLIPGSLSGLRIQACCKLQSSLQMQLGSSIAMAVVQACGWGSKSSLSLGTSICHRGGPKIIIIIIIIKIRKLKKKKTRIKKKERGRNEINLSIKIQYMSQNSFSAFHIFVSDLEECRKNTI